MQSLIIVRLKYSLLFVFTVECNLRPDKDNPNLYIQLIPGFGPVSRPCAPGSTFKMNICSCARKTDSKIYEKGE